jgi:hypothetical protein
MAERPVIANLDFNSVKDDLVNHFKSREEFTDYEFTGSSLNLLMDILSYNTHYYSLASNFLLNESFLDSALLRQNVVSLAKSLNYVPRSTTSAFTDVTVTFTKQADNDKVVIIPAGTPFISSSENSNVTFYTKEDYALQFDSSDPIGTTRTLTVTVYEGSWRLQRFTGDKNYTTFSKFSLPENNIDTTTITVSVNGIEYQKVLPEDETLFNVKADSTYYFLEENRNGSYNIIFGDGIAGKPIQAGDEILVSYLVSQGENGNGVSRFSVTIPGRPNAYISSVSGPSNGGASKETIQSIKDNAPKWFQAQYRAVTTNDYEVFLKKKFADIQAVSVYGGEDIGYPGKVFICIKPKSADKLSNTTKSIIKSEILSQSNVVTVRPEIVDPKIFKVRLETVVVYDKSKLPGTRALLRTRILNLFDYMGKNYVGDFLSSFRESNLSYEIKNLHPAIVSSNTRVKISADVTVNNFYLDNYTYNFNNKLYHPEDGFLADKGGILGSSLFYREGRDVQSAFDDDGRGNMRLFDFVDGKKVYVNNKAGRINYETGEVEFLYEFRPQGTGFRITVVPDSVDVIATQDMILQIDAENSLVEIIEIEETDLLKNINLSRSF